VSDQATQKIIIKLQDNDGKTGRTEWWQTTSVATDPLTQAGYTNILPALLNLTACTQVASISETVENVVAGTITAGPYTARDHLVLKFRDSFGNYRKFRFPAPLLADFTSPAYLWAVTTADTPVPILAALLQTNMVDRGGGSYQFVLGWRDRSNRLRAGSKRYLGAP
jgi:hypothetical protein